MLHKIRLDRKGQTYFRKTREVIPKMLRMFEAYQVKATWAIVGMLMAKDRKELMDALPSVRPVYSRPEQDPYRLIDAGELGRNEKEDPFHFAPSLIHDIQHTPGQEIGTHTFSHFYCEEDQAGEKAFEADLMAAQAIAEKCTGKLMKSLVFPRNQVHLPYQSTWQAAGIRSWRDKPAQWFWQGPPQQLQSKRARAIRLLDHYLKGKPTNIRFFRPYMNRFDRLGGQGMKIVRIKQEMSAAARAGKDYHLWWHPHNMATHPEKNLQALDDILSHFRSLHDDLGMESQTMGN